MQTKIILAVATVAVVAGVTYVATKKDRIPLPPELEKERQESEREWQKLHENDVPWVKAEQSSSDCPECVQVVENINMVANLRNDLHAQHEAVLDEARNLSDSLKLAIYNETQEWDRVTDLVDIPEKSWWDKLFGNEGKIYDIVLPEDAAQVTNPNKIIIPESLLANFRELQRISEEVRVKIRTNVLKRGEFERHIREVEEKYAKAIADFNSCTSTPSCKKKNEKPVSVEPEKNEEKFSTSILDIRPMEDNINGDRHEISPNIYNRQKLGHADYASRTKFKISSNISCGKTEGIAWWQGQENNPMGIRWYADACRDSGIVPKGDFKVEMYFDNVKFAECEYSFPVGSKPCARFDK